MRPFVLFLPDLEHYAYFPIISDVAALATLDVSAKSRNNIAALEDSFMTEDQLAVVVVQLWRVTSKDQLGPKLRSSAVVWLPVVPHVNGNGRSVGKIEPVHATLVDRRTRCKFLHDQNGVLENTNESVF